MSPLGVWQLPELSPSFYAQFLFLPLQVSVSPRSLFFYPEYESSKHSLPVQPCVNAELYSRVAVEEFNQKIVSLNFLGLAC